MNERILFLVVFVSLIGCDEDPVEEESNSSDASIDVEDAADIQDDALSRDAQADPVVDLGTQQDPNFCDGEEALSAIEQGLIPSTGTACDCVGTVYEVLGECDQYGALSCGPAKVWSFQNPCQPQDAG